MSKKLFVGCRVRIKYSYSWPELAGQEGRVVAVEETGGIDGCSEWIVAPDCWGTHCAPRAGNLGGCEFAPDSSQLEPVTPSGAAPSEHTFHQLMDLLTAGEVAAV